MVEDEVAVVEAGAQAEPQQVPLLPKLHHAVLAVAHSAGWGHTPERLRPPRGGQAPREGRGVQLDPVPQGNSKGNPPLRPQHRSPPAAACSQPRQRRQDHLLQCTVRGIQPRPHTGGLPATH